MSNYDPLDVRGQADAKSDKDTRAKLARDNDDADFKWLMGSKRGRRIVSGLLNEACFNQSPFNHNAMQMSFATGRQTVGIKLFGLINRLCPELYPVMIKENVNDRSNADD
jgi:hypothetical protein